MVVVMVGEGGGGGGEEVGLAIKSYNLQHTLGEKQKQHSSPKNNNTYAMESINVCIM